MKIMELKDYINIFKQQVKVFGIVVAIGVLGAVAWQKNQPENYQATLLLNIGRRGVQNTQQYQYDGFYRLQADERFADTVVRWFGSPRVVEDIYTAAELGLKNSAARNLKNIFSAKRLSSQMLEITYTNPDVRALAKISQSAVQVLNRYAASLNQENTQQSWFIIIGSDPVIRDARVPLPLSVAVAFALSVFAGFWIAILTHYLQDKKT